MTQEKAIRPHDPVLFRLVCEAVKASVAAIATIPTRTFIPEYYGWGKLAWFPSGLPHLEGYFFGGGPPKDYHHVIGDGHSFTGYPYPIQVSTIPAYKAVESHLLARDEFGKYEMESGWSPTDDPDWHAKWRARQMVTDVVDRWMHLKGDVVPNDNLILPLYSRLETPFFCRKLPIHIVVPFICLRFGFEQVVGADGTSIVKMSEKFQLARMVTIGETAGIHPVVANAATHALVFPNWELPNESRSLCQQTYSGSDAYPIGLIDTFFAALRTITGCRTGYAHLLMQPLGWAMSYKAHLPPVVGTTVRVYPPLFDRAYWHTEIPTVSEDQAKATLDLYDRLRTQSTSNLAVASRRLNDSYLRERDDDAVIDALIGLESLLTDDGQEITHKLSLRVAAICRELDATEDPLDVMKTVKKLYSYRSKIVHGKTKEAEKLRASGVGKAGTNPRDTAIQFLRSLLRFLAEHPSFLSPAHIDEDLLLQRGPEEGKGAPPGS